MNGVLRRTRALAQALDSAFRIPGTRLRFGLDPLLGLFPGVGDVVGGLMSGYLLWAGARAGAPPSVLLRMFSNILIDVVLGAVPVLGDLFDAGWKANLRNAALLERFLEHPRRTTVATYLVFALLLLALAALIAGAIWLIGLLVRSIV